FKGMNNTNYMTTSPTGITSYTNIQVDETIKCKSGFPVQENIWINTWAVKLDISNNGDIHSEGNGSFTGTLLAVGNITSTFGNITSSYMKYFSIRKCGII
ncbi:MAG: hypothetical protein ACKPKO_25295, partial [Candidatus Fonsibacter sp.]